jgi:hypothetical protein
MEHGFVGKHENIYNIDEKGCKSTLHHRQEISTVKGVKGLHFIAPEHDESVNITAYGNVLRQALPLMVFL